MSFPDSYDSYDSCDVPDAMRMLSGTFRIIGDTINVIYVEKLFHCFVMILQRNVIKIH